MATPAASDLVSELQDLTSCSICLKTFTDPRALPCMHCFCRACLQGVVDTATRDRSRHIACPLCKKGTPIPQPLDEFPKAFFFNNLCEMLKNTPSSGTQKCRSCLEDNNEEVDASWICMDCANILCDQCKRYHIKYNKSHLCISLINLTAEKLQDVLKTKASTVCMKHNKELEYYCKDCNELLCVACKITDKAHEQHTTEYTKDKEVVDFHRNRLVEFTTNCEEQLQAYKSCMDEIDQKDKKTGADIDKCIDKIEERFQEAYQAMKKRKDGLTQQAESIRLQHQTGAKLQHNKLTQEHDELKKVLLATTTTHDDGSDIDVIRCSTKAIDESATLLSTRPESNLHDPGVEVLFECDIDKVARDVCGEIKTSSVINAQQQGDFIMDFNCSGLAQTEDGHFMVAQYNTNNMFCYSKEGSKLSKIEVADGPGQGKDLFTYKGDTYFSHYSGQVFVYNSDKQHIRTIEIGIAKGAGISILDDILYYTAGNGNCVYKIPLADPKQKSVHLKHNDMKWPLYVAVTKQMIVVTCSSSGSNNIVAFTTEGEHLFTHGGRPQGSGYRELNHPLCVAIYKDQYVIAADYNNNRLVVLTVWGMLCGYIELEGQPWAVTVDSEDNVVVSMNNPHKIVFLKLNIGM